MICNWEDAVWKSRIRYGNNKGCLRKISQAAGVTEQSVRRISSTLYLIVDGYDDCRKEEIVRSSIKSK